MLYANLEIGEDILANIYIYTYFNLLCKVGGAQQLFENANEIASSSMSCVFVYLKWHLCVCVCALSIA